MDFFTTGALRRVVNQILPTSNYLTRTYFPAVVQSPTEEIYFDVVKGSRRISPFVSPLQQGQLVERVGYYTQSLKPAYIKDKRVLDPNTMLKRAPGEAILGELSPAEREALVLRQELADQIAMVQRRLEVMAGQVLATGSLTISGDLYPTTVINYARTSGLTVALTGGNRWGQAGVDPLASLRTWSQLVYDTVGVRPNTFTMTPDAYNLFVASSTVQAILQQTRNTTGSTLTGNPPESNDDVWEAGSIGGFNVRVYQQSYIDIATNTPATVLPAYTVFAAVPSAMEGYVAYGAIRDPKAGYQALPYFPKSWVEEDPAVRYIMLQSAPIVAPTRPDASFAATVN